MRVRIPSRRYNKGLEALRQQIAAVSRVVALTGAGISAESGVPTFRGAGGLWNNHRAEDLATPEAFQRNRRLVWEWYDWRRQLIAGTEPNAAHLALANLEKRTPSFTLITQNVDGLHDRAGSRNILKLHGDIWRLRCLECRREWDDFAAPLPEIPPRCACGGVARPGVVWFGEALPRDAWNAAEASVAAAQMVLVIGTSAVVYPAAGLVPLARESGATIVEVNLEATPVTGIVDHAFHGKAGEILPELLPV